RIAPSIGVDQSFQGLDQLGVMMDQRLSSGPRMPDSLNGEGALRKALDGPIDGRARKTSNTGDDGNTSSSQSLAIEGCNQVLLSLIEVRKQQGVLPLKFFGFAHSRIIPSPSSFVTLNLGGPLGGRRAKGGGWWREGWGGGGSAGAGMDSCNRRRVLLNARRRALPSRLSVSSMCSKSVKKPKHCWR